jgi:hypothetical protein
MSSDFPTVFLQAAHLIDRCLDHFRGIRNPFDALLAR